MFDLFTPKTTDTEKRLVLLAFSLMHSYVSNRCASISAGMQQRQYMKSTSKHDIFLRCSNSTWYKGTWYFWNLMLMKDGTDRCTDSFQWLSTYTWEGFCRYFQCFKNLIFACTCKNTYMHTHLRKRENIQIHVSLFSQWFGYFWSEHIFTWLLLLKQTSSGEMYLAWFPFFAGSD